MNHLQLPAYVHHGLIEPASSLAADDQQIQNVRQSEPYLLTPALYQAAKHKAWQEIAYARTCNGQDNGKNSIVNPVAEGETQDYHGGSQNDLSSVIHRHCRSRTKPGRNQLQI